MKSIIRGAVYPSIIVVLTSIACVWYWVSLLDVQQSEMETARHFGELHVEQINEAVDQQLDATIRSVDTALRHLRTVYLQNRKDFDHSAQDILVSYPKGMLQFITVFGADGYLAYSSDTTNIDSGSEKLFFGDREHFRVHADTKEDLLFISKPIIGRITGIPLIQITRPIRDGKRFVGVIGIPLRPDYIAHSLWSLHIDPNDLISIVREDGSIIVRSRNQEQGLKLQTPSDRPFMHSHAGDHGIYREISITEKIPLLYSWRHLANYPVIAVTAIDEVTELREISDQQSVARGRALLAMALILAFAIWISALILRVNRNNLELSKARDELEDKVLERTANLQKANSALQAEKARQEELIEKLAEAHTQLLQSEKMASIGQLAAGVAHEINNPIGFVNSNLGTLKHYIEDLLNTLSAYEKSEGELATKTREGLDELKQQIDLVYLREDVGNLLSESMDGLRRVKRIVQDLKDFSHVDEQKKQLANLEHGLDSTLNVVWNELKYKADVVKEYGGIPEIECIPSQLNQVFMNLLMNAVQAIDNHGRITIRTGQEGENIWIEVEDTGKGIKSEHLDRIFDPFFTTKPVGKGTGLGLSLSFGIVKKHGGRIEVKSELGKGTIFSVVLPQHGITVQSPTPPTKD